MMPPEAATKEHEYTAFVIEIRGKVERGPMDESEVDAFCNYYNLMSRRCGIPRRAFKRRVIVTWRFDDDAPAWDGDESPAGNGAGDDA